MCFQSDTDTRPIKGRSIRRMFSLCRRYKDEHEHGGTQIKGGYMLRYKRKYLWNSWSEEWVVLYDDSTMAWFKDASGKYLATQKYLVKESPEMLAIANWTGQVPRRPTLPPGARLSQLMALGSRRDPGHVVWMLAKSDAEMKHVTISYEQLGLREKITTCVSFFFFAARREWMQAISKTLPPPPHIELVMSMPYLRTAFKRPTVRVRPTSSEMYSRSSRQAVGALDGRGLVAVIKRQVPLAGQLGHELAWGQGWGWVTLPNGVWSGRLTWSQEGDDFALHAMPIMHHTNVSQACSMLDGVTAYEASAYDQALAEYDDAAGTSDDWDFGVDCGDFMM
ncbi:uncharacterized protein LOC128677115 isoform X1 [Plodia interpunctella]|uniref:uncharacterized protein LOC128677115 isoform X1 n=1 Tax=Plodia interpunctella TaxID=58824 RepID=UPI002367C541|nr:uncharacterized protein LOC128677115 isoform X1 [Plodia interpunctella]